MELLLSVLQCGYLFDEVYDFQIQVGDYITERDILVFECTTSQKKAMH